MKLGEISKNEDNWVMIRDDQKLNRLVIEYIDRKQKNKDTERLEQEIVERLEQYGNIQFPIDFNTLNGTDNEVCFLENY